MSDVRIQCPHCGGGIKVTTETKVTDVEGERTLRLADGRVVTEVEVLALLEKAQGLKLDEGPEIAGPGALRKGSQ